MDHMASSSFVFCTVFVSLVISAALGGAHGGTTNYFGFDFPTSKWKVNEHIGLGGCAKYGRNGDTLILIPGDQLFSVGRAFYKDPAPFYNSHSNATYSFTTDFSFTIDTVPGGLPGDGFAFFIGSDNSSSVPEDFNGEYLGLYSNATDKGDPSVRILAVEFDTYKNMFDINDNHAGLDIDSVVSVVSADLGTVDVHLTSGDLISVRIEYNASTSILDVYVFNGSIMPTNAAPVLSAGLAIYRLVKNPSDFVGFSAGTGGTTEVVTIHNWRYKSWIASPPL